MSWVPCELYTLKWACVRDNSMTVEFWVWERTQDHNASVCPIKPLIIGTVCCQLWFHLTAAAAGRPDGVGGRVARVGPASRRISHTRVSGSGCRSDVKEVCRAKSSIRYGSVNPDPSHLLPLIHMRDPWETVIHLLFESTCCRLESMYWRWSCDAKSL